MIDSLLGVLIWVNNPEEYKLKIYDKKYNQVVREFKDRKQEQPISLKGNISWYATGKYKDGTEFKGDRYTTACYRKYRGKTFRVTYKGKSVVAICDDTGAFETNGSGRVLDLSLKAFEVLASRSQGIIREAKIEIIKEPE